MHIELLDRPGARAAPDIIDRTGWLASCRPPFRRWALDSLQWRFVPAGTGISYSGDQEGGFFCLAQGQITFQTSLGGTLVTTYFGHPGAWWGQAPLLGIPRIGTVTTRTGCIIGILPMRLLEAHLAQHPADWEEVARGVSDLMVMAAGAHADLLIEDSRNRVAATLLRLGANRHRRFPQRVPHLFECTQDELAHATGLSRNTAGGHLRSFERERLIRIGYRQIGLLDIGILATLADADS